LTTTLSVFGLSGLGSWVSSSRRGTDGGARGGSGARRRGGGSGASAAGATESRTDGTRLDVRESNGSIGLGCFDRGRDTGVGRASTTHDTRVSGRGGGGVSAIEPEHVGGMVVPDTHDEDHTGTHGFTHGCKATLGLEVVGVTEGGLLVSAEVFSDGVVCGHSGNVDFGVLDDLAILNIQPADFAEGTGGGVVARQELSDDGELFGGIDGKT